MHFTKSFILSVLLCFGSKSLSQIKFPSNIYIEPTYYTGSVMPQLDYIDYLLQDHIQAYQLSIGINTNGSEDWHRYLNYPRMGFGFYHSNLGNDKVFGYLNALFGTVTIKTLKNKFPVNLEHNLTAGIGAVTTRYYLHYNSFNIAIGSPYNFFLQYSLLLPVRISPQIELYGGVNFTHISVANIIEPNNGLNMGMIRFGCRYNLNPVEYISADVGSETKILKKHYFTLVYAMGRKQFNRMSDTKYWVYALSPEYCYKLTPIFGIGAGVDFYYDTYIEHYYWQKGETASANQIFHATAHATLQLFMGNLSFLVQPGCYIYKKFDFYDRSSYKFGFKYQFLEHVSAGILLKTHWLAQADVLEFGCGYTF